jgi:hypothetical protein
MIIVFGVQTKVAVADGVTPGSSVLVAVGGLKVN